jgi:fatty-acyl-CoA synthase
MHQTPSISGDGRAPRAFADLLRDHPEMCAFHCRGHSATRGELLAASQRAAAYLAHLGFTRGDTLALWLPDGAAWLQFLFAAAQIGALVVPISTRYRQQEARHVVATARARAIVVATDFLGFDYPGLAKAIKTELPCVEHLIEVATAKGFFAVDPTLPPAGHVGTGADSLCTFSTSGTTGNPKLAVHDQVGIARHATNVARRMDMQPGDVMLCALSLYGVLGFVQAIAALAGGAACVFLQVFEADAAADAIERHRVTHFFGSDGIFDAVLNIRGRRLGSWRWGGFAEFAGLGSKIIAKAERDLQLPLIAIYGSSECFALTAARLPHEDRATRVLAGGTPTSDDIEFRVVDAATGRVLGHGERGELQLRGFNVMSGYLNNPGATAAALSPDGWFHTGDLAYTSGTSFVFLSRLKDGLRLRGYLVDPFEIEEFLARHQAVVDAQVVGVNRTGEGDIAVAFVRARSKDIGESDLMAYCKSGIANFKVPRRIVLVDEYPTVNGPNGVKILKHKLRDLAETLIPQHQP